MTTIPHIAVIGAGAFGGWSALNLRRRGARVTLIDAWGPGNSRSSSSGETRVIRGAYGPDQPYTKMAAQAISLWREHERRWQQRFFHRTGVLWMAAPGDDQFERGSLIELRAAGIPYEELPADEIRKRWPQINTEGVRWAIYEPEGGFLLARESCQSVVKHFVEEGGAYRQVAVLVQDLESGRCSGLTLSDGSKLVADHYVFACGPWLGKLFPQTVGKHLRVTKQEVFFFGTPAGDDRFSAGKLPVWADRREHFMYGIPGENFKVGDDTRGAEFDPTSDERTVSSEGLALVRDYLGYRFPGMKDAPLVDTWVCQYENTPDNHFIADRHPRAENVWIVGGGSGHGFKHGPVIGEMVAGMVLEGASVNPLFRLARFQARLKP